MYYGPLSDHFDGERFFNPGRNKVGDKSFLDILRWRFKEERTPWPTWVNNTAQPKLNLPLKEGQVALTFVNHASWLIQLPGFNILTDPVWSQRTSPWQWLGPKRVRAPGVAFEDLPPIDLVVVSHNHYDHMDEWTLRALAARHKPQFLVALGDQRHLEDWDIANVREMDWWDRVQITRDLHVQFTPTQHWSSRAPGDRNACLWGGFVFQTERGQQIYFGGDAGYSPWYKEICRRLGPMDLAMLPIGAYEPRWFMREHHMNPEEAILAHLDLCARRSVGIHYGCWQLTDEGIYDPVNALTKARVKFGIKDDDFGVQEVGETRLYE